MIMRIMCFMVNYWIFPSKKWILNFQRFFYRSYETHRFSWLWWLLKRSVLQFCFLVNLELGTWKSFQFQFNSLQLWEGVWRKMSKVEALKISLILLLLTNLRSISSSLDNHRYNVGDHVPLFVNKVGPLNNPRYPRKPRIFSKMKKNSNLCLFSLWNLTCSVFIRNGYWLNWCGSQHYIYSDGSTFRFHFVKVKCCARTLKGWIWI